MRRLRNEAIVAVVGGVRALVVVPEIPDGAPADIREGLVRRRLVALGRTCPCGARPAGLTRAERRAAARRRPARPAPVARVAIEHAETCPAGDDVLLGRLREWAAAR